jgi:hypothetical protein
MRIRLESVGGFVGPASPDVTTLDAANLGAARVAALQSKLAAAQLEKLPADARKAAPSPQDFLYRLTVDDQGAVRTHTFHLEAVPAAVRELVQEIEDARDAGESERE